MCQEGTPQKRKPKSFAVVNGACRMAKLSDGYAPKTCPVCGTNHRLNTCPWYGYVRGKK